MFKLKFGIMWLLFVTPIFILCLVVPGEQRGGADMTPGLFLFFAAFEAIGVYLLTCGIKQIKKDKKTNKFGEITYGKIVSIYGTGSIANGREELQAEIQTYLPYENTTRKINEIIGFSPINYNVGDLVQLKYHEDDVNIVQVVSEDEIPNAILALLIGETVYCKYCCTIIDSDSKFCKKCGKEQ